jgi:hypothetical protein
MAAQLPVLRGYVLGVILWPLTPHLTMATLQSAFPTLDQHLGGICPPFCLGSFRGEGSWSLVGEVRAWLASCLSLASVDLVGARPLSAKQPLEGSCRLRRLWLSAV